jgi:tRNA pseudouridine55 synthase
MDRVLIVDKPRGLTSHDVVQRIRWSTGVRRVGHAGTLDPPATGVLVVLVGRATRLAQFLAERDKEYRGEMVLGVTTDTQDSAGAVLEERSIDSVTEAAVRDVLASFVGETSQIPPMVSALKRQGTPLHVLARRGITVEREPRTIRIERLRLLEFAPPSVSFDLVCSKGTYVRTLAADAGERLGCGAHLGQLVRLRVGPFSIEEALPLDEIVSLRKDAGSAGRSMFEALDFWSSLRLSESEAAAVATGGAIEVDESRLGGPPGEHVRLSSDGVALAAVGRRIAGGHAGSVRIRPVRVFPTSPRGEEEP